MEIKKFGSKENLSNNIFVRIALSTQNIFKVLLSSAGRRQKDEKEKEVIVLSGESSSKKAGTENWLKDHGLGEAELYVRPEHNTEPDYREKSHILNEKL